MRLKELLLSTDWGEVKQSLLGSYPDSRRTIDKLERVFERLLSLDGRDTKMRLCLAEVRREGIDEEPYIEVFGKDGTLNRDLPEFRYFSETARRDFANLETSFALELVPWEEWLGMELDPSTSQEYSDADLIAHCLWEMTFFGLDQATIEKQRQKIDRRVKELEGMSEEDKKELITLSKAIE
jgi:hypothetical protein